ncbi:ABC transporter ATP-binding protein [Labrys monachus]|uniref:ABC-type branched-subunit amino acid transport system ATPase component n=1 Tax=Labrys monachus TaxID=217067 RepID=A0ABU0FI98_9HYPH|nr:ABC transporter ATP-binding protein [Labrys monachus]MDQ0394333.1 ABC-type branched-subunit amino acid transport system ATPase component [Labrys monachus]
MTLLTVAGIEAGYGQMRVLRNVGFAVEEGEFLGILGHNGMGKSTLLKAISGDIPLTRGRIALAGQEIGGLPPHRRARLGLGYVPQGRQIFPALTVRENMAMAALASGRSPVIVDGFLALFPRLKPIADRAGGVLSGGEQQILALARCLCGQPRLLLLDEPTEGVQPSIRDEIVDTLHDLRKRLGLTILLVEQNVQFMESLADRILQMEKGCLSAPDNPAAPSMAVF